MSKSETMDAVVRGVAADMLASAPSHSQSVAGRDFKFTLPIEEAYVVRSDGTKEPLSAKGVGEGDWLFIEGFASDTNPLDSLNGTFSERAVLGMINCVYEGTPIPVMRDTSSAEAANRSVDSATASVGIDIEHSDRWPDDIGYVESARAVYDLSAEQLQRGMRAPAMWVRAAIDLGMSHGRDLKRALQRGKKLGFSVYGKIVEGWREVNRATKQTIDHFELVNLKRIAITQRPANPNMWLADVRRSMTGVEMVLVEVETPFDGESNDMKIVAHPGDAAEERELEASAAVIRNIAGEQAALIAEGVVDPSTLTGMIPPPKPSRVSEDAEAQEANEPKEAEAVERSATVESAKEEGNSQTTPTAAPAAAAPATEENVEIVERSAESAAATTAETLQKEVETPLSEAPSAAVAVAEPAEQPSVVDATLAAPLGSNVERSEFMAEREVLRTEIGLIKAVLAAMPAALEEQKAVARSLTDKADALEVENASLKQTVADLTERLEYIEGQGKGRKGTSVSRSLEEVVEEAVAPDLSNKDTRKSALKGLLDTGDVAGAIALLGIELPNPLERAARPF